MQPLVRISSRAVYDLTSASLVTRSHARRLLRPSVCLHCRLRTQSRHLSNDTKPSPPLTSNPPSQPHTTQSISTEDVLRDSQLPSHTDSRRNPLTKRFSHLMDNVQGNIFIASQRINDLTGYSGIEALKTRITRLESQVQEARDAVRASRLKYKTTVADRAATQREVTTLLARKDSWTPADLERFTSLYRMDHSNEQAVQEAATRLADAESAAEHAAATLSSSILARYHEEQIWSDKIRRMSTWGTWGLMGVNVLLFLVFQFGFEPWRRRRLVRGFEEKVREALEMEKKPQSTKDGVTVSEEQLDEALDGIVAVGIQELQEEMQDDPKNADPVVDALAACITGQGRGETEPALQASESEPRNTWSDLTLSSWWTASARDLFSERIVPMRKQDVTLIALEGAATGAAIVTIIATFVLRSLQK